jgi:Rieske Fe-S protein
MERREYITMLAAVGIAPLSGCGAIETVFGGKNEDQTKIDRIKKEAKSPSWNELMQDMDEWKGEPVHYSAVDISAIDEINNGSFRMTVEHPDHAGSGDKVLRCTWFGDQVDIENTYDIWGTVKGKHTYSFGEEKTVPDIKLVDIQPSE